MQEQYARKTIINHNRLPQTRLLGTGKLEIKVLRNVYLAGANVGYEQEKIPT